MMICRSSKLSKRLYAYNPSHRSITWPIVLSLLIVLLLVAAEEDHHSAVELLPNIETNSTVLVTGAAGFLGSQVSLAILRLYGPKHLVLLDNFESTFMHDGSSSSPPFAAFTSAEYIAKFKQEYELHKTQQFLTLLEYKRQRIFTILQSCVTTRNTFCKFYKADLRPSIPEYFDIGEIPLLNNIFEQYDVTHVIHLANEESSRSKLNKPPGRDMLQSTKAGMTETMLEQLRKENKKRRSVGRPPVQYVFRSSYEVYSEDEEMPARQRDEMEDITSPANLHGTYKRIDEILSTSYADFVPSVGLRFFPVYGPWDSSQMISSAATATTSTEPENNAPILTEGLDVFSLCERMVSLDPKEPLLPVTKFDDLQERQTEWRHLYQQLHLKRDWVYIDDAVDAILSAVQYPMASISGPIIFNVGGGSANGTSIGDIINIMEQFFPRSSDQAKFVFLMNRLSSSLGDESPKGGVLANMTRSKYFLNFEPRISMKEGIQRTLSWHYDRLHPYGLSSIDDSGTEEGEEIETMEHYPAPETILSSGIAGCSPLDKECLRGSAIFPCLSECANPRVCLPSIYDTVVLSTRKWTMGCSVVLYTVLLGKDVGKADLPNANVAVSSKGRGFVDNSNGANGAICNLAFVTEGSRLVNELKTKNSEDPFVTFGFWTLVPVPHLTWSLSSVLEENDEDISLFATQEAQMLIPKLSPGNFFASSAKYAVYISPRVVLSDLNSILNLMSERPRGGGMAGMNSGTSMLLIKNPSPNVRNGNPWEPTDGADSIPDRRGAQQESAYQSIEMGLHGQISLNMPNGVDSSFVVHALQVEDARLFRCDVYAEMLQWESFQRGETKSLEFVVGLHNLWSRLIMQWAGYHPWWEDEVAPDGSTVVETASASGIDQILRKNLESFNEGDVDGVTSTDDAVQVAKETTASAKEVLRSKWLAILSSKSTHQFVRIVPAETGLVVKLDLP